MHLHRRTFVVDDLIMRRYFGSYVTYRDASDLVLAPGEQEDDQRMLTIQPPGNLLQPGGGGYCG